MAPGYQGPKNIKWKTPDAQSISFWNIVLVNGFFRGTKSVEQGQVRRVLSSHLAREPQDPVAAQPKKLEAAR